MKPLASTEYGKKLMTALISCCFLAAALHAQDSRPQSKPSSRPTSKPTSKSSSTHGVEVQPRKRDAEWGRAAPGRQVMPFKLLPIEKVPYRYPKDLKNAVAADDLVIGYEIDGAAYAYPIKMLGGPDREIINLPTKSGSAAVCW